LQWFSSVFHVFFQVFQTHVLNVSSIFFCMLQLLHLDVLKVYQRWHMGCAWKTADDAGDVQGDAGPLLGRPLASPTH
jgi:hypothetical protein